MCWAATDTKAQTDGITQRDKPVDRPLGRPLKRKSLEVRTEPRGKWAPTPQIDIRFDEVGHWPERVANKGKCRNCKRTCRYICIKCSGNVTSGKIHLCLEEQRNCFYDFHTPQWLWYSLLLMPKQTSFLNFVFPGFCSSFRSRRTQLCT